MKNHDELLLMMMGRSEELFYFDFNGTNQVGETYRRLIPDPLNDDFSVKFTLYEPVAAIGTFVAQNVSGVASSREFQLFQNGGDANLYIGGSVTALNYQFTAAGDYEITFIGTTYTLYKDGLQVDTDSFTRGVSSESTATFTVGARHDGTLASYSFYYNGGVSNVEVSPVAPTVFDAANYPMDEKSAFKRDTLASEQAEEWSPSTVVVNESSQFTNVATDNLSDANAYYRVKVTNNCDNNIRLRFGNAGTITISPSDSYDGVLNPMGNSSVRFQTGGASDVPIVGTLDDISVKIATEMEIINWSETDEVPR